MAGLYRARCDACIKKINRTKDGWPRDKEISEGRRYHLINLSMATSKKLYGKNLVLT
jgi:hypothetical protein